MNITDTKSFFHLVRLLRTWPREIQIMALYAAQCWDDDYLVEKEAAGELPGRTEKSAPVLTLITNNGD
jgi:hypothetical protein